MYAKKLVLNNPPSPGENHFFHLDERLYGMLSASSNLLKIGWWRGPQKK
jgi:hypothetical protein